MDRFNGYASLSEFEAHFDGTIRLDGQPIAVAKDATATAQAKLGVRVGGRPSQAAPVAAKLPTEYPASWVTPARTAAAQPAAPATASSAGIDYPAHFDTRPVDGNSDTGNSNTRHPATFGTGQPASAGTDYPANWKR